MNVLQRPAWYGEPQELGDLFRVEKTRRHACAALFTRQFGWEVRLLVGSQGEAVRSQGCRSQDDVLSTGETWKAALVAQDWSPAT